MPSTARLSPAPRTEPSTPLAATLSALLCASGLVAGILLVCLFAFGP